MKKLLIRLTFINVVMALIAVIAVQQVRYEKRLSLIRERGYHAHLDAVHRRIRQVAKEQQSCSDKGIPENEQVSLQEL